LVQKQLAGELDRAPPLRVALSRVKSWLHAIFSNLTTKLRPSASATFFSDSSRTFVSPLRIEETVRAARSARTASFSFVSLLSSMASLRIPVSYIGIRLLERCIHYIEQQNMSSNNLRELFDTTNIHCDKRFIVRNGQEALANFVRQEMEGRNWSTYDVVRESGGLISSNSTVWNVLNERGKEVKDKTLRGLAKAFGVSDDRVFDIYLGKSSEPMTPHDFSSALEALGVEQFSAYGGVQKLTLEDQQEIIAMIEVMVEQKLKRKRPKK
jgi:transcriptional regulator with XRE-family HTH domain